MTITVCDRCGCDENVTKYAFPVLGPHKGPEDSVYKCAWGETRAKEVDLCETCKSTLKDILDTFWEC